ncbi:unnamed protein product [Gongylonema pulchrum]|uniref:Uncharacterized protein n=1 Tax=Gongylonema pulchrum TaxID=637853 RepID=A0A183D5Q0_9BILA|nr:unnamed protein product [Gongylonema pulchrum]
MLLGLRDNYLEVQSALSNRSGEVKDTAIPPPLPPPPPPLRVLESSPKRVKVRPHSEPIMSPAEPVDTDSDSEFDSDSHPLLSGKKAVLCEEQSKPCGHYAFTRRYRAIPTAVATNTSLLNERNLNSTATVSIDSAIGSPLWSAGTTCALPDSEVNDQGGSSSLYKRRSINGHWVYPETQKPFKNVDGRKSVESGVYGNSPLGGHYVNVSTQETSTEKGNSHLQMISSHVSTITCFNAILHLMQMQPRLERTGRARAIMRFCTGLEVLRSLIA